MVNNDEWLGKLGYIELLRDVGPHFTINRMLTFDSVKLRLEREQPLTFLEFNYMILQAYDFRELSQRYGCRLQMGGSDQWGNIVNGIELAPPDGRGRAVRPDHAAADHGGRREDGQDRAGAVWLNEDQLPDLRFLAILAQCRRPRRRPVPAAVHRSAAGRDRPARSARKAAKSTTPRSCWPTRLPGWCAGAEAAKAAADTASRPSPAAGSARTCQLSLGAEGMRIAAI